MLIKGTLNVYGHYRWPIRVLEWSICKPDKITFEKDKYILSYLIRYQISSIVIVFVSNIVLFSWCCLDMVLLSR